MKVVVVDYGAGNVRSAAKALERAATDAGLQAFVDISADPEKILKADRLVMPGDGAYPDCKAALDAVSGLGTALFEAVKTKGTPYLGICIGMQMLATRGFEITETQGLGWIHGNVRRIVSDDPHLKIPHMGWNTLQVRRSHPLLNGLKSGEDGLHAYFLHSYALYLEEPDALIADVTYGGSITAVVAKDNLVGTQFHPEKSQTLGLQILANFLRWKP